MDRYSNFLISHKKAVIFLSILAIFIASYGLKYTKVETDYEIFFDSTNQRLMALREMEKLYGRQDVARIAIEPKHGDVFQPEVLKIIEAMTAQAWSLAYTRRVDSLTNHQFVVGIDEDLLVENLFDSSHPLDDQQFERRKQYALTEPTLINNFVNKEGTIASLLTSITIPQGDSHAAIKASAAVTQMVDEYRLKYPEINFYLTGSIVLNELFFHESTVGTAKVVLTMLAVMLILLACLLRSLIVVGCVLVLLIGCAASSLGIASWFGIPFSAPSSTAPIIIATMVVANAVHIISALLDELRKGINKEKALIDTLRINIEPVFLTTLTTVIGYLCLNTSDVPPYRDLGTTTTIGVINSFILTYTLLPALLAIIPFKVAVRPDTQSGKFWFDFGAFAVKWRHPITIGMLIFAVSSSAFITRNVINNSLVTFFDKEVPFRVQTEYIMDNLTYFYTVALSIPGHDEGAISDPVYMRQVEALAGWARHQPEVYAVVTYTDVMKQINRAMHNNDNEWYRLPENKELASQYLLLYEMSLPYGFDLDKQLTLDKSSSRLVIGFHDLSSSQFREFDDRLKSWISTHYPQSMQSAVPSSAHLLFANIHHDSVVNNLWGMLIGTLLISLVIMIAMRSVTLGLLSLIPNIIPAMMAFGLWGLIKGQIDIGTSIVGTIALGIIVDDTVHFMSKFRYACMTLGYSPPAAVQYAFATVGKALFITTVVLVLGFSMLMQSNYTLNSSMGLLTAILLTIAFFFDLFLLPALLMFITPIKKQLVPQKDSVEELLNPVGS